MPERGLEDVDLYDLARRQFTPQRVIWRLLASVQIDDNGCWISNYSTCPGGYIQMGFSIGGKAEKRLGHRVSYIFHKADGPIFDDQVVDHICKVRRCINPDHLRLLTRAENSRDQANFHKTHCIRGHSLTDDDNVYHNSGGKRGRPSRQCRACKNLIRRKEFAR